MTKIKIIHWDDQESIKTDVMVLLRRNFREEDYEYQFFDSSIDELIQRLITEKESFDLLLLDLLDKKGDLVATKLLKQLHPEHNVIVLTQHAGDKVQLELDDPLIKVKFEKAYKCDLIRDSDKFLIPLIKKKTGLKRKQDSTLELNWDEKDILTNYQISIVTEEHLVNLLTEYLNITKEKYHDIKQNVRINPLVSGFSGALVFQVEFFFESTGSINILLKVDKIKSNLTNELKLAKGSRYQQINLDYRLEYDDTILISEKEDSCWYALTSTFILEGETLKHRILRDGDFDKIKELILTLFDKCLSNVYSTNIKKIQPEAIVYPLKDLMNILTNKKKAFILNTVKELSVLSNEISESKVRDIFNFPDGKKALSSVENRSYNKLVLAHGDMHGNNIMVSKDGQIKIIDPANMDHDHWARDLCMLIVDLFAYGIDYENKQYFGIVRINTWRKMGNCLFEGTEIKNNNKNKVVCKVLSNLTNKQYIKTKLGFNEWYEDWEFQLSLVIEFLRISYKSNQLPAGKRAACMLTAFDGFEKAQTSYKTFIESKDK